jgi:putative ubiquitin-RnfH superfamily antitoxin RatB of RatAB toxin-antitoxin module
VSEPQSKRCVIAWATRTRQYLWPVELEPAASIASALAAARARVGESLHGELIPWDSAPVGIFGAPRRRSDPCADGDRIELYRPLQRDPRLRRREQVARARRAAR